MFVNSQEANGFCWVRLHQQLTSANACYVEHHLLKQLGNHEVVEIDLGDVETIDAEGVRLMVRMKLEAARQGKIMRWNGAGDGVAGAMEDYRRLYDQLASTISTVEIISRRKAAEP
jgi:ABC-type transporter Mla MlaB component